jgi:maltose-binding protein MalE
MNWPRCCIPKAELVGAALLLLLSGCQPRQTANQGGGTQQVGNVQEGADAVLYLYVEVNDNIFDLDGFRRDFNQTFRALEQQFRQVNPRTHFVVQLYRESSLLNEVRQRNASGLGPDLLLVSNRSALQLARAGLTRSPELTPELRQELDPATLSRASLHNPMRLASLPVAQKAQLACFNRMRLQQVPTTLQELLAISANGNNVGLALDPSSIFWSAGALGATQALQQATARRPLNPEQQQALARWTRWLQDAATQQKVTFYGNQDLLIESLSNGQLDWISCHSTDLQRLQRRLGSKLGVAPLPDGPDGQASPINELTVMALGVNSSAGQRKAAEAFAHFALNPLVQRNITISLKEVLPVNRFVTVPAESSMVLKAMLRAQQQSRQAESIVSLIQLNDKRMLQAQGLITRLVFGESTPEVTAQSLIRTLQSQP